jgi:O-methyltransferase
VGIRLLEACGRYFTNEYKCKFGQSSRHLRPHSSSSRIRFPSVVFIVSRAGTVKFLKQLVRKMGYDIRRLAPDPCGVWSNPPSEKKHTRITPSATYSPWIDDVEFCNVYQKVKANTLVDIYRCYELWDLVKQAKHVEGDVLEVGVWRGGTGALIARAALGDKRVFLADTFAGVVKAGENDTSFKGGEYADTSAQIVYDLLRSLDLNNVQILEGVFPEDTYKSVSEKLSFVHCDVDVYSSAKDIVEWCMPRLAVGAVLVFDDFGFYGCEGVTTYCEELKRNTNFRFVHNLNGHAVFVRVR